MKTGALIVSVILLLVLPPLSVVSQPVAALVVIPGILFGFLHSRYGVENRKAIVNIGKMGNVFNWVGIIFALLMGVVVLIARGSSYLFELDFYSSLWRIASLYYGVVWIPYLLGANLAGCKLMK